MSRFAQTWAGEREPRLRSLPPAPDRPTDDAGPAAQRFATYVQTKLADLPAATTRLALDRLKVRLCDRLTKELHLAGTAPERAALLATFTDALDQIAERMLDVEPPELVEHVFVRDPAPTAVSAQQAMGFFLDTGEG